MYSTLYIHTYTHRLTCSTYKAFWSCLILNRVQALSIVLHNDFKKNWFWIRFVYFQYLDNKTSYNISQERYQETVFFYLGFSYRWRNMIDLIKFKEYILTRLFIYIVCGTCANTSTVTNRKSASIFRFIWREKIVIALQWFDAIHHECIYMVHTYVCGSRLKVGGRLIF